MQSGTGSSEIEPRASPDTASAGGIERELTDVDDAGTEQCGRLEDDDVGGDVGIHARDVELHLEPPGQPQDGRLERRRTERWHGDLDPELAGLTSRVAARAGEGDRQAPQLLARCDRFRPRRPVRVVLGARCAATARSR